MQFKVTLYHELTGNVHDKFTLEAKSLRGAKAKVAKIRGNESVHVEYIEDGVKYITSWSNVFYSWGTIYEA